MNRNIKTKFVLFVMLLLSVSTFGQTAQTSKPPVTNEVKNLKLDSKLMTREMPYRVILPANYDNAKDKRFPVVYLLHGLTGHFDNWTNFTKLAEYSAKYNYIIVTPEGENGWYSDSETLSKEKYESYIVKELIPEIDKNFRTLTDRKDRSIAGLSMGGYGSIKFGLKYPQMFSLVGSFSGALPATTWDDKTLGGSWKVLNDSIMSIFGATDSKTRQENDIYKLAREATPEKIKDLPFIYLDCGTEDFLIKPNRDFSTILLEKKIPHEFRQLPGKHDWKFWDAQVQEFFELRESLSK